MSLAIWAILPNHSVSLCEKLPHPLVIKKFMLASSVSSKIHKRALIQGSIQGFTIPNPLVQRNNSLSSLHQSLFLVVYY